MKRTTLTLALLMASSFATPALAGGHIGLGSYATSISDGTNSADFAGAALNLGIAFGDYVSVDANVYSLENDSNPDSTADGYDAMLRIGNNGNGFSYFIGFGAFSETWKNPFSQDRDFSGAQLGLGLGYNWESVGITLEAAARDVKDYEDKLGATDLTAASSSFSVFYRF